MEGDWRQIKLLLWKDYLIRKRNLVTLGGVIWATLVIVSLVIVRSNIDVQDKPTCQFPARALPSAGTFNFLQSFICSINNECSPLDEYEEIPRYENSKIRKLERQFAPLLYNETILSTAELTPDALKLVATIVKVIDEPEFHVISRRGIRVKDLFGTPDRIEKLIIKKYDLHIDVVKDFLEARILIQNLPKAHFGLCNDRSVLDLLEFENNDSKITIQRKLCSSQGTQEEVMVLLSEVNFSKYFKMAGSMLHKLNGEDWLISMSDMASAIFRIMNIKSFIPTELASLQHNNASLEEQNLSYFNFTLLTTVMDLLEPTFGETEQYKTIRGLSDSLVDGVQWLHKTFFKSNAKSNSSLFEEIQFATMNPTVMNTLSKNMPAEMQNSLMTFDALLKETKKLKPADIFSILTKLANTIMSIMPASTQHEVLYYATLLTKLIEGTHYTVLKNVHMEEIMFTVTKRHPGAVKIIANLPPHIIGKMFDALSEVTRVQVLTSKMNNPGQLFCDKSKLQQFFVIGKVQAENIRKQLCTNEWKNYVVDVIRAFGIFDVRASINQMASLVIMETIGKDTTDQLYSIEKDLRSLENFVNDLKKMSGISKHKLNWARLLNINSDADFFQVINSKIYLFQRILITIHGAFAKEVIKQNPILEAKITPILIDSTYFLTALNDEIAGFPKQLIKNFNETYPEVFKSLLLTLSNETKTYKILSTHSIDIMCKGITNAENYFDLTTTSSKDIIVEYFCSLSKEIERTMNSESKLAKSIQRLINGTVAGPTEEINWPKLINSINKLFDLLNEDYPFLFQPTTYGMNATLKLEIENLLVSLYKYWFNVNNLERFVHLCIKIAFRLLDLIDSKLFELNNDTWIKLKHVLESLNSLFTITNRFARFVTGINSGDEVDIPQLPRTVAAMKKILPNLPVLLTDTVDLLLADNTSLPEVMKVINGRPLWPCSATSLADVLSLHEAAKEAVEGIELILCLDMKTEWSQFDDAIRVLNIVKTNSSEPNDFQPHLFLKVSGNLDELIDNIKNLRHILGNGRDDNTGEMQKFWKAWHYAVKIINSTDNKVIFGNFFSKLDEVIDSIDSTAVNDSVPLINLWEDFTKCSNGSVIDETCTETGRAAYKYTLKFISNTAEELVTDLYTYFSEVNEPRTTLLSIMGFTRRTPLNLLYNKLADFVGVLLNSYWDLGFMHQVRRASNSQFWDCESLFESMVIPLGSNVTKEEMLKVKPYICPSVLFWISLPMGENILLDLVAKPQYLFFNIEAKKLNSTFKNTFNKSLQLNQMLKYFASEDYIKKRLELNVTKGNSFEKNINEVFEWKIDTENPPYRLFGEINKQNIATNLYLTQVAMIVTKIKEDIINGNLNLVAKYISNNSLSDEASNFSSDALTVKAKNDVESIQKLFKRRPAELFSIHFDAMTRAIWDNSTLLDMLIKICNELKDNNTHDIISENDLVKQQFCSRDIRQYFEKIYNSNYVSNKNKTGKILRYLVEKLEPELIDQDIVRFFNRRQHLISLLKYSVKYTDDLGLELYVKYLSSNLLHYEVILDFLTGINWWSSIKKLYNGSYATTFFTALENGFVVAEDWLTHVDKIRVVKLLKDINVNRTEILCYDNISLAEYVPDGTGVLSKLKEDMCNLNQTALFLELPPLQFASQGYEYELSKDVNYVKVDTNIDTILTKLDLLKTGPKNPFTPEWISDEKIERLRQTLLGVGSKETLVKITFGVIVNIVDGVTLFMNSSDCPLCSKLTAWFKQINLQLIKKDEYDNLLCHMHEMSNEELYNALKHDFHWDMAIQELISTRNYTNYELNKSINSFLDNVKLDVLIAMSTNSSKLQNCVGVDYNKNVFGNLTLFTSVTSKVIRLLRSTAPHLKDIEAMRSIPYLKKMSREIAPRLHVVTPLTQVLANNSELVVVLQEHLTEHGINIKVSSAAMDLFMVGNMSDQNIDKWLIIPNANLKNVCQKVHCKYLAQVIKMHINQTAIKIQLRDMQIQEFWTFRFVTDILYHIERLLDNATPILGVASKTDMNGIAEGQIIPLMDFGLQILQKNTMTTIIESLQGVMMTLHPLLRNTPLDFDLDAMIKGLEGVMKLKDTIVQRDILNMDLQKIIANPQSVEIGISHLGLNNTNFWSMAAPKIMTGSINLNPLLESKDREVHVRDYACNVTYMAKILEPGNLDDVTADDVYVATIEQFCQIKDDTIKEVVPIVLQNINFTYVMDKMMNIVLSEVFVASNLSKEKGNEIISKYNSLMSLVPLLQENMKNVSEMFMDDPFFQGLRNFSSVGGLLQSPDFLDSAGKMLCGKNLIDPNGNRFYRAIAETKDFSNEPDPMQLEVLPTDFCRSLYKDIIQMGAGKIIWSFVKPLMMGRILYTPETIVTKQIVQNANRTFARMSRMRDIVHGLSEAFTSMDTLSQHKESVRTMKSILDTGILGGTINNSEEVYNEDPIAAIDFDILVEELEKIKDMEGLVSRLSKLLHCLNLNRFVPFANESSLTKEAVKLTRVNEFAAGVVFVEANSPYNVEYKIRMDIESVPTTSRIRNQFWTPGPAASFIEDMRYFRGFVQIQDLLDKAIIQVAQNNSHHIAKRDVLADSAHDDWALYTQQMPYPCYRKDIFQSGVYESQALIVAFFFSLILTVSSVVRFTVWEKESGNTKLMSVMGLRTRNHTFSWLGASLVEMLITNTCMFVVLKAGHVLPKTDSLLLWLMIVNFGFAVLMFCYMVSKLFKSASLATVCAGILYLVTFMPYVIVLSMEAILTPFAKFCTSLSMSTAFSYSLLVAARYEAAGEGLHWRNVWTAPDPADYGSVSAGHASLLVSLDALLYAAVGWLLNKLLGKKEIRDNLNDSTVPTEKAGVSIVNVTKVYNEGTKKAKKALEGVSIELQKGQITTLLGQNGAGKTTLIKIITGMMKATSGHIVIRMNRAVSEAGAGAVKLGICPQGDVLIESLTAVEHLRFYALLKSGCTMVEVDEQVKRMVHALCMGGLAYEPVHRLSGGLRRRLCVALAFIADPSLVLLDEPSSGVDPVARRDIWSLILKLKEDRTVLLTTHHLDEAELLSDQIVIMHKGQVHTTGSPLEIKRSLGNGYKLMVNFPKSFLKNNMIHQTDFIDKKDDCLWQNDDADDKTRMDTYTKLLMDKVRSVITNAQVVSLNEMEVEVLLPFFDDNGRNNDFLKLCDTLERNQEDLKFSSYGVDCSSLEQVFFNVCQQIDGQTQINTQSVKNFSDKSSHDEHTGTNSTASMRNTDLSALVPDNGRVRADNVDQYKALLWKRWLHYSRNWWLLFLLFILPTIFVIVAMGFSLIRPPADNEIALKLEPDLYENATEFLIKPSSDSLFAQNVLLDLEKHKQVVIWQESHNPHCECVGSSQKCNTTVEQMDLPELLELPDSRTLNDWIISTQKNYIEKRYGGWSSSIADNVTNMIAWYNNKGHHAMPSFVNALNAAILRHVTGNKAADITSYTHPLKISDEQLSRSTLLQHVADVGISAVILIAFSLVPAAGAIYLVKERCSQEKRLQLLCGVRPWVYWAAALTCDMIVIVLNIFLTICVLEAFAMPAFVVRENMQAICLLLFLFGFACSAVVHLFEKMFKDASLANMVLFCANLFVGVSGLAILLILDIISDSELTDNARWTLHKIFMLSPQFTLGDGLVEIAKNTIQAQVLKRFGMDTYKSPLGEELIPYHYVALALVGAACVLLNLAIEYGLVEHVLARWRTPTPDYVRENEMEDLDVCTERYRVELAAMRADTITRPIHLQTIGNINAGFVNTEGSKMSLKQDTYSPESDVIQCISLRKEYNAVSGKRVAVKNLTIGIPRGQCLALLGENGAGKSTTFSLLTGQERPTAGQLRLRDQAVTAQQLCQGYISYCPQSDALDPLLTVTQILQFYCLLRGISNQNEVIGQTMRTFELEKYVEVRVGTLSGGNKRKLCTAVALMGRTPLVLLDEPTSGMDVGARSAVRRAVRAACGGGRAVLLSTHALSDARHLAARLALLHRGRLTALAPTHHHLMFGGGYVVCVRCGDADRVWRAVESTWPAAQLHGKHHASLRFLLPYRNTVSDSKQASEVKPSEIFRVMATLQGQYDIEDFTVNQSSIEQMFSNTSERVAANQSIKKPWDQDASAATVLTDLSTDALHSVTSL